MQFHIPLLATISNASYNTNMLAFLIGYLIGERRMGQVLRSPVCFCLEHGGLSADSFNGLFVQEIKIMNAWLREDVSACRCNARTYRHVYCPCLQCRGTATDRTTELRHRRENCLLNTVWSEDLGCDNPAGSLADDIDIDHGSLSSSSSSASPSTPEAAEGDEIFIEGSDKNHDNPISPEFESVEPAGLQGKEPPINPLKKVIMTAVLDALKLMDESGSSIKTFSIL